MIFIIVRLVFGGRNCKVSPTDTISQLNICVHDLLYHCGLFAKQFSFSNKLSMEKSFTEKKKKFLLLNPVRTKETIRL